MFKSKKPWFVPKSYGYGLVPVSWQGWLMTLVLIIILGASAYANNIIEPALYESADKVWFSKSYIGFLIDMILILSVFMYYAEKKTEGEVKWRWGKK